MEHKNILLVEDEYLDIIQVQRELGKLNANCTLHTAFNGKEAIRMLKGLGPEKLEKLPDIVLLDINMPKMNGLEFLSELREDVSLREIPVFVMSTSWEEYDRSAASRYGIKGYILKPLNFDTYTNKESSMDTFNLLLEILR
jgi:CheY-like chemotaxis protein